MQVLKAYDDYFTITHTLGQKQWQVKRTVITNKDLTQLFKQSILATENKFNLNSVATWADIWFELKKDKPATVDTYVDEFMAIYMTEPEVDTEESSTAPEETLSTEAQKAVEIIDRLQQSYPVADIALKFSNPFELLIATILAAQCTDDRVNKTTPALFAKFPDALSFANAEILEIEKYIRSISLSTTKAKSIHSTCKILVDKFNGQVPAEMELLLTLPGVGRKTANMVLTYALNVEAGITVDTHVKRLSNLLGFTTNQDLNKIEADLLSVIPQKHWKNWSSALMYHGREICKATKPNCDACVLANICPSSQAVEPQAVEPQAVEPQAVEPQAVEPQAVEPQAKKKKANPVGANPYNCKTIETKNELYVRWGLPKPYPDNDPSGWYAWCAKNNQDPNFWDNLPD